MQLEASSLPITGQTYGCGASGRAGPFCNPLPSLLGVGHVSPPRHLSPFLLAFLQKVVWRCKPKGIWIQGQCSYILLFCLRVAPNHGDAIRLGIGPSNHPWVELDSGGAAWPHCVDIRGTAS